METSNVQRNKLYSLDDSFTHEDCEKLGVLVVSYQNFTVRVKDETGTVKAVWTGEYRVPEVGEWYLSKNIIEAYKNESDMMKLPCHIARLVVTKQVITEKIIVF